eukprot:1253465-Amphidinium_carterae.1
MKLVDFFTYLSNRCCLAYEKEVRRTLAVSDTKNERCSVGSMACCDVSTQATRGWQLPEKLSQQELDCMVEVLKEHLGEYCSGMEYKGRIEILNRNEGIKCI